MSKDVDQNDVRIRPEKIKKDRAIVIDQPCTIWLPDGYRNAIVIVATKGTVKHVPAPQQTN